MEEDLKRIAIELLLEKSERNFNQAKYNAQSGFWDLIVNRLYYSIFHAVNALLLLDGINTKSHKGTSQQFGLYYVKTGIFDESDGKFYHRLQTKREQADYDNVFKLSEEEGNLILSQTEALQRKILAHIKSKIGKNEC